MLPVLYEMFSNRYSLQMHPSHHPNFIYCDRWLLDALDIVTMCGGHLQDSLVNRWTHPSNKLDHNELKHVETRVENGACSNQSKDCLETIGTTCCQDIVQVPGNFVGQCLNIVVHFWTVTLDRWTCLGDRFCSVWVHLIRKL